MRTLPVRFWLWLLLLAVVAVPAVTTLAFVLVLPPPPLVQQSIELDIDPSLRDSLRDGVGAWSDPAWQTALAAQLEARGLAALLIDDVGNTVYRSPGWPVPGSADEAATSEVGPMAVTLVFPTAAGAALAALLPSASTASSRADLLWFNTDFLRIPLAQMAALLLIVAAIALFVHRAFLRPLANMVAAMRQIGDGDLGARLPRSRVAEVDEVATAFGAMAEALRHALERESALEQERRMTIGALVHDLRTPLFSLRGHLEGLATGLADTPEKAARYLRVCRDKADALERLVSDLFDYTRIEYLEEAPRPEPLELGELLRRTAEGLEPQAEAKAIRLVLDGTNEPVMVTGDPMLLMRVIENILDNAVRYTPSGGEVRLAWGHDAERATATFTIADTGPGIPANDLPHLFTPFYRGDASRNRRTGGVGLGLAIARRLLRAHDGELSAGSTSTGGASFMGTLPLLPAETLTPSRSETLTPNRDPLRGYPACALGEGSTSGAPRHLRRHDA